MEIKMNIEDIRRHFHIKRSGIVPDVDKAASACSIFVKISHSRECSGKFDWFLSLSKGFIISKAILLNFPPIGI
jgi:hypothetical protein